MIARRLLLLLRAIPVNDLRLKSPSKDHRESWKQQNYRALAVEAPLCSCALSTPSDGVLSRSGLRDRVMPSVASKRACCGRDSVPHSPGFLLRHRATKLRGVISAQAYGSRFPQDLCLKRCRHASRSSRPAVSPWSETIGARHEVAGHGRAPP